MEVVLLIIFVLAVAFVCYRLFSWNPLFFICNMDCQKCSHQMCTEEHKKEMRERADDICNG